MATSQPLHYAQDHEFWKSRVRKEIVTRNLFEDIVCDNIDQLKETGHIQVPGTIVRSQFNPAQSQKLHFQSSTKFLGSPASLHISSSYTRASDPNSMRNLERVRGLVDFRGLQPQKSIFVSAQKQEKKKLKRAQSGYLVRKPAQMTSYQQTLASRGLGSTQDLRLADPSTMSPKHLKSYEQMLSTLNNERQFAVQSSKQITDLKMKGKNFDKGFELSQMRFGGKLNVNDFAKLAAGRLNPQKAQKRIAVKAFKDGCKEDLGVKTGLMISCAQNPQSVEELLEINRRTFSPKHVKSPSAILVTKEKKLALLKQKREERKERLSSCGVLSSTKSIKSAY